MLKNTYHPLYVLFVCEQCILGEALQEVYHEIEAIMVDLLQIDLEFAHIALFQLFLNELHLL